MTYIEHQHDEQEHAHGEYGDADCCDDRYYHNRREWPKDTEEEYPGIALAELLEKIQGPAYHLALADLRDSDDADDIVQIVSEKACRYCRKRGHLGRYPYKLWRKVTNNAVISYVRHRDSGTDKGQISIYLDDEGDGEGVIYIADANADTESQVLSSPLHA